SCTGQLPLPDLSAGFVAYLRAALTGHGTSFATFPLTRCYGRNLGDNVARGYVTVDTVNNCTLKFPGDAGYFAAGGTGDATNQNVLWGDYFIDDTERNLAVGNTLVHIEASPGVGTSAFNTYLPPGSPETTVAGQYTFYGRYDKPVAWSAIDN